MPPTLATAWLAAASSVADQLRNVPKQTWLNLAICVFAVIIVVRLWKGLKKLNDYAPWFAAALAGSFILFYWVYERNEPEFMTPVVEKLSFFMPTKGKQQQHLEQIKKNREAIGR